MNNIVFTTEIGTPVRNAFDAWAGSLKKISEDKAKAKRWKKKYVQSTEDQSKHNALFLAFVSACEKANKNYRTVAETLRNEG